MSINISTRDELLATLEAATGGETLLLAPGDYGYLGYLPFSMNYASEVTITSADPDNPASFSGMKLDGAANVTFDGIKFDYDQPPGDAAWSAPFRIVNSDRITIRDSTFDGDLAEGMETESDGFGTGYGLFVDNSSNVSVEESTFYQWWKGAHFGNSTDITVTNNELYHLREDGLTFANVNDVLVEGNHIRDFRMALDGGHRDMIQFWSSDHVNTNITIRGNILNNGDGASTQTIFMKDAMANILIEDNLIHNAHLHGITTGGDGVTVRNNTLLQNMETWSGEEVYIPKINIGSWSTNVVVENNVVPNVWNSSLIYVNDLVVLYDNPNHEQSVENLFVNALAGASATLADLQAVPGGLIEERGVGAAMTRRVVAEPEPEPEPDALATLEKEVADLGSRMAGLEEGMAAQKSSVTASVTAVERAVSAVAADVKLLRDWAAQAPKG